MLADISQSISQALQNQFLSGGAILMVMASIFALLRKVPQRIGTILRRQFIVSVEVHSKSEAYDWVVKWLASHPKIKKTRTLSVNSSDDTFGAGTPNPPTSNQEKRKPTPIFSPGLGTHFLFHRGRLVWLRRDRDKFSDGDTHSIFFHETITFYSIGRSLHSIQSLIQEAASNAMVDDKSVKVRVAGWDNWYTLASVPPRDFDSIVLAEGVAEDLLSDAEKFLSSKKWYVENGVPYKRGYLLEGPPGNGKTSIVLGLASRFDLSVYVLSLSSSNLNDQRLMGLMLTVPENSIVLVEDISRVFNMEKKTIAANEEGLTFGGLLQALDGISSGFGRILVMTDNHLEKIEPVLIRPGRIDMQLHIGNATPDQAVRLYRRFYGDRYHDLEPQLASKMQQGEEVSMAYLQEHFIRFREEPIEAIRHFCPLSIVSANGKLGVIA